MCGKKKQNNKTPLEHRRLPKGNLSLTGFTLLELILAVAIFSVVATLIYSSFRLGIMSWRKSDADLNRYQEIKYAITRISDDMSNAFMYTSIPFKGEEKEIAFASFINSTNKEKKSIGKILYSFTNAGTEEGTGTLIRQEVPYFQAVEALQEPEMLSSRISEQSKELLSGVIDFSISYCYQDPKEEAVAFMWFPQWMQEDVIPAGIKLQLIIKDDYAPDGKRTFEKRIYIPAGEFGDIEEFEKTE